MSKHQQSKVHSSNRVSTSMSVGPETSNQIQEQIGPSRSQFEVGFVPAYGDIQRLAYQIHEEKGGGDLENWLEAEQMLKEKHQQ